MINIFAVYEASLYHFNNKPIMLFTTTYILCSLQDLSFVTLVVVTQEKCYINTDLFLHCIYTAERLLVSVQCKNGVSIYIAFFLCYLQADKVHTIFLQTTVFVEIFLQICSVNNE